MSVLRCSVRRLAVVAGAALVLLAAPAAASTAATGTATVTVTPTAVVPGGRFTLVVDCGAGAISASVSGTTFGGPSRIPLDPYSSGGPGAFTSTLTVPATLAGSYQLHVTCGDGETGIGVLVVSPSGAPAGGDGAPAAGVDLRLLAVGSVLALAATGAVVLLRRRSGDAPVS